ncbi:uncharacterized protein LOC114328075 [Diabrotica virgifera virgifera]|uniref:WAP domain-containing protein n=1 Tax=Diabrotica virgifera virgifera TaxID=50390 RepID=A0ABM5JK66_DIAVI|nr:uncharacterized protein LOC114328075 [Diabrotica virgifera virgifera]
MFQKLVFFACLQVIFSYYLYNDKTNQVISYPALDKLPEGFKIIRPPRTLKRAFIDRSNLVCQDSGFHCKEPFDKSATFQFECEIDDQCPQNYKCCPQKCFKHKICSQGNIHSYGIGNGPSVNPFIHRRSSQPDNDSSKNQKTPRHCQKWPYPCSRPYSYHFSNPYKCDIDAQCPQGYLCCQQDCFLHKICSKELSSDEYVEELRRDDQSAVTKRTTTLEPEITSATDAQTETTTNEATTPTTTEPTTTEESNSEDEDSEETTTVIEITTKENDMEEKDNEDNKENTNERNPVAIETTTEKEDSEYEEEDESEESEEEIKTTTVDPNAIIPEYKDYYDSAESEAE